MDALRNRLWTSYVRVALLLIPLLTSCASRSDQIEDEDKEPGECEREGESCECDDEAAGDLVCRRGTLECSCTESQTGNDDDEIDSSVLRDRDGAGSNARRDASGAVSQTDSGKPADAAAGAPARDASSPSSRDASTAASDAAADAEVDASPGSTTTPPTPTGGMEPKIPPVMGDCPEFMTGTVTVMGTSGISMVAGPKKEGTGSILFYWHGTGSSWSREGATGGTLPRSVQTDIVNNGGVIFAINESQRTGGDCSGTGTFGRDDFKITDLIVACGVKNHGINPRRIYTTGCSAGGLQAGCMATSRPEYLAAALPNSGGIIGAGRFTAGGYVPAVMTMYGPAARDMVIIAFENSSRTLMQAVKGAGGFAVGCNHGTGHCAAPEPLYESGWKFLLDHPYGTKPSPYMMGLPAGFDSSCKIF